MLEETARGDGTPPVDVVDAAIGLLLTRCDLGLAAAEERLSRLAEASGVEREALALALVALVTFDPALPDAPAAARRAARGELDRTAHRGPAARGHRGATGAT